MSADKTSPQAAAEARTATVRHQGPTTERYQSVLHRYVEAVAGPPSATSADRHSFASRTVGDVMNTSPLVAHPEAGIKQLAAALERAGASAVPVVDDRRRVVGVVTVSDLLARSVGGRPPRPRRHLLDRVRHARRRRSGRTAADLMTSPAVTTTKTTPIVAAAELAARARVRALPVVDAAGSLVGVVSRSDLMRAFLRPDEEIQRDVERDVVAQAGGHVTAVVSEGIVRLTGRVSTEAAARRVAHDAHLVPGVIDVHNELAFDQADRPFGAAL